MTRSLLITFILLVSTGLCGQSLTKFSFSDCLKGCEGDSSVIKDIKQVGPVTTINLKTYAPCSGNLTGGIEMKAGFLNLKYWTKSTVMTNRQGKKVEVVEVAECDCMFDFQYQLKDSPGVNAANILVNGRTLREIDSLSIIIEEKVVIKDN